MLHVETEAVATELEDRTGNDPTPTTWYYVLARDNHSKLSFRKHIKRKK
jgi:hypothetical protein